MSFWPRFKLTPGEERVGVSKYYEPVSGKRGVLRKVYHGQLMLNATIRNPVYNFQIARRSRVFALTASGDIQQFRIQLQDSSGEQYLAQPVSLASLLGGYVELPPPVYNVPVVDSGGFPATAPAGPQLGWVPVQGHPVTNSPLVFEPNIVLDSNQSLTMTGYPITDYNSINYRVDMCIHVWEFPAWQDGPR